MSWWGYVCLRCGAEPQSPKGLHANHNNGNPWKHDVKPFCAGKVAFLPASTVIELRKLETARLERTRTNEALA
jgi:hypothetical protein